MPGKQQRKTISLDQDIYDRALTQAQARGFRSSFSAYVAWLIERDAEGAVQRESLPPRRGSKGLYLNQERLAAAEQAPEAPEV